MYAVSQAPIEQIINELVSKDSNDSRLSHSISRAFETLRQKLIELNSQGEVEFLEQFTSSPESDDKESVDRIRSLIQEQDIAFIIVSGALEVLDKGNLKDFNHGYLVSSLDKFIQDPEVVINLTPDFKALLINKSQLKEWLKDDEFKEAFTAVIRAQHPIGRATEQHRKTVQGVRDDNRKQLVSARLSSLVSELLEAINPSGETIKINDPAYIENRTILGVGEQLLYFQRMLAGLMLDPNLFDAYPEDKARWNKVLSKADEINRDYNAGNSRSRNKATLAFGALSQYINVQRYALRDSILQEVEEKLKDFSASDDDIDRIKALAIETKWLEKLVNNLPSAESSIKNDWEEHLKSIDPSKFESCSQYVSEIIKVIDQKNKELTQKLEELNPDEFHRIGVQQFDLTPFLRISEEDTFVRLDRSSQAWRAVLELSERLNKDEKSAVGGRSYAIGRIPPEVVWLAAQTDCPIYFVDGTRGEAIRHIMIEHGASSSDPNVADGVTVVNLTGQSGDNPKFMMSWRDGRMALVITYPTGIERVTSYALSLALYHGKDGKRIDPNRFRFLQKSISLENRIRAEIKARPPVSLESELSLAIFNRQDDYSSAIETTAQNIYRGRNISSQLVLQDRDGKNIILPGVGAHGLYGEAVGYYLKALSDVYQVRLTPHIIFSGLSGVFSDTEKSFSKKGIIGLPKSVPHLGLVIPTKSVFYDGKHYPIKTAFAFAEELIASDSLSFSQINRIRNQLELTLAAANSAGVLFYDRHASIWGGPGRETDGLINDYLKEGVSSIDVEGGPLARTAEELGRTTGRQFSVTLVYVNSDDPRQGITDLSKSFGSTAHRAEKRKTPLEHINFFAELNKLTNLLTKITEL